MIYWNIALSVGLAACIYRIIDIEHHLDRGLHVLVGRVNKLEKQNEE